MPNGPERGGTAITVRARWAGSALWLSLLVLFALYSKWVLAADPTCGDPPAVTNERIKGEVEVKADAISKILGALGFGAAYEKSREDIFSKYGDSNAARADQYLYFLVCNIVLRSTTMTDQEKLEKIETLIKMRPVMPGAPAKRADEPGPPKMPPPKAPPPPGSNPAQVAEHFVRLAFSPSSTVDDIIGLLHVPFCAERDIILSSADDLRTYVESLDSDNDIGKYIVSVVGTQIINQIDFRDLSWFYRDDKAKQTIGRCLQNDIVSPSDYMITICVRMMDLKKDVLTDVIVDKKSRLIKLFTASANRCSL